MSLEVLDDLSLHEVFKHCDVESLDFLRVVCSRFNALIDTYRHWYSKHEVLKLIIEKRPNGSTIFECQDTPVIRNNESLTRKRYSYLKVEGSIKHLISQLNPRWLTSNENEELCKMHPQWWNDRKKIEIHDTENYEKYLPHFRNCSSLILKSSKTINLGKVLNHMSSVSYLELKSDVDCEEDNFDKLINMTKNFKSLRLHTSSKSKVTTNTILKIIEKSQFKPGRATLLFSRIYTTENELKEKLRRSGRVDYCNCYVKCILIRLFEPVEIVLSFDELVF